MSEIRPLTAEPIEHLAVDSAGAAVTGATGLRVSVRRVSDGFFYDWSDSTFKTPASVTSLYQALSAVSATYAPGTYAASWPGGAVGVYVAEVTQSPAGTVVNVPARAELRVTAAPAGATELAAVQADVDDLQARTPAALVGGRMDASVGAMATDVVTSGAIASSAVAELQAGLATAGAVAALPTAAEVATATASTLAGAHGAGSWATATGYSTHSAADVWAVVTRVLTGIGSSGIASQASLDALPTAPAASVIADAVWDEPLAGHATAGSAGAAAALVDVAVSTRATAAGVWATAEGGSLGTMGYSITLLRKWIRNRLEVATTASGREILYDDDGTTPLLTWPLRDGAGNAITTPADSPARRGAAT